MKKLIAIAILVVLASCGKNNNETSANNSSPIKEQIITSSDDDKLEKIAFSAYCKSLDPLKQITQALGQNRIDLVCTCGYQETLKNVSKNDMKIALSAGAGIIDPEVAKVSKASQLAIASCLENLEVPESAKKLTSSFADVIKLQVKVQDSMGKMQEDNK
jgi:hypothetical protein